MADKEDLRCPWCGCTMELGYLYAGNESIRWVDEKPGAVMGALRATKELYVSDEGVICQYKQCWYCQRCGRLVMETARPGDRVRSSEECADEFRRYAEQARKK